MSLVCGARQLLGLGGEDALDERPQLLLGQYTIELEDQLSVAIS